MDLTVQIAESFALGIHQFPKHPQTNDSTTHIAAGVMFLDPSGRALFVKRSATGDHAGEWCFPGGAVEAGETVEQAAMREAREEVGIEPMDLEEIDRRELDGVDFTTYTAHCAAHFIPTLNREHTDHVWRRLDDPPEPLHPGVRATVDRAVLGDEFNEELHPRHPKGHPDGGKFAPKGGGLEGAKADIDEYNEVMGEQYSKHLGFIGPETTSSGKTEFVVYKGDDELKIESILAKHGVTYEKQYGDSIVMYTTTPSAFDPEPDDNIKSGELLSGQVDQPAPIDMKDLTKVGGKKGSNEGGVYEDPDPNKPMGKQYYIKTPKTKDHVQNELTAAALYKLAGVNTMEYVPVKGGDHVATVLRPLDKDNISKFTADERHEAQKDFAVHAWLANWDAAGTGGDNQVIVDGKVTTVDTGGSLKYRAQGEPKGDVFGDKVTEIDTLRDPSKSPDAAALYGNMKNEQIKESIKRVTDISDDKIINAIQSVPGMEPQQQNLLANKLIARKNNLAQIAEAMSTPGAVLPATAPVPSDFGTPKVFKTKIDHAKHLLAKGTTKDELSKALGWSQLSVPATAKSAGMKLEKSVINGVTHYKGIPMTAAELAAAKGKDKSTVVPIKTGEGNVAAMAAQAVKKTPNAFQKEMTNQSIPHGNVVENSNDSTKWKFSAPPSYAEKMAEIAKNHPEWSLVPGMKATYTAPKSAFEFEKSTEPHDINTTEGNFKQALENLNVKYGVQKSPAGEYITITNGSDVSQVIEVAKYHPQMQKLSANEYFAPAKGTPQAELVSAIAAANETKFPPATPDELKKAAKNTKLTAQYVPGAPTDSPEAEKLIAAFNAKYEGKEYDPAELQKKVDDFKKLQTAMVPLMNAQQKIEAEKAAKAAEAAAIAKAKANEIPEFNDEAAEELYWYNKAIGSSGYLKQAQSDVESTGAKGKKLAAMGLTVPEVAFIKAFTGIHSGVNENLIKGKMDVQELAFKQIMNGALDKMEPYEGKEVYRKIHLNSEQQADYVVGKIKQWTNFSSTSKNKNTWSGNTHFTIKNPKTGVDVQFISVNPGEAEVIMPADTHYMVISKTPNQDVYGNKSSDTMHIVLEEVVFGKKKKKKAA